MSKNIFEQSESRLEQERNVFLQKYGIAVRTDLQRADEIEYATDTQVLNKPKDNYFGMTDMEEPTENIAERALKEIPFNSLALSSPITASAYLSYKLAKTPFFRGIFAAGINTARTASAKTLKDAATLGVAAGMDIDTRLKEHQKIDEEKAGLPASLRFQDKLMGDGGRVLDFLNPFEMVDEEKTNERFAAWKEEQKKVDDFNEKVKIHVDTFLENTGLARTEEDGFWYDLGSAGGSILTSIALLAATRNPLIGAMIFGQAEGQGTYEEAVASGVAPEKAYALGQANAAWIAMTEVVGDKFFSKLLYGKGIMGKFSKKIIDKVKKGKTPVIQGLTATAAGFVKGGSIEAIQEASQNVGSDVIALIGGVSEKTAGEIVGDALYAGFLAAILGSGPGGIATYSNYRKFTENVSATLQDAGMEKDVADKIGREVALTATGKEMMDESLKAVSSEIDSPLTAEDRDPQKFAQVLTESQKREVEESSWKVGEKVEQDALKAGVAPEVAEASGRVAQALNNNFYTLAKITPTDQKNFNISVLKGSQNNQVPFDMRGEGETQTADIDFSSLDSVFNSLPKDKAEKLFNAIREDARVRVLLDKAVLFREELLKKSKAKTLKEMRDYMTQEEKTAVSNFANELEKTQLKIAKELIEKESDVFFQGGKGNARDLFATHNMNLAGAKQAVKMGGLAMPSMAIRKTDSERVAEFGDVSFVGNENLVKPSRSTEVYDRDAWTPSIYNSLRYRLSKNAKQKIEDILKKTGEEKQRSMYVYNIEEYFSDATRNEMALDLFLKEKGLPEEERQKKWNSPEYISWYNETFFDDATPYLFTENDDNTDMVERKFTLNNVMKVLRKQERAAGGYIGDHLFSVQELIKFFPQKFRNLKELRAKKQNLQTTEQIFEKIEELDKDFDSLIAELRTSGEEKEYGADRHAVGIAIANTGDLETQKHWLHNAGLPSDNETISKINKFAERIKNEIPVSYFEAKPRKVVDFGQFSGVIMPNTKDYDGLANDLETKYNLPVFRVEKGNAQQYKEALSEIQKQVPTTFFQNQESPRGMVEIDEQAHEAIIRVFENSDPSTIIHELAHIYLTMINNAANVSMDPEFQQLVSDINAWLGEPAGENGAYSVEQQEMFARGFEGYMAEGKSPNKEMEGIFAKFAEWLAEVYQSVKDYLQITPEVRSIFDRLLSPEETVKKSKYVGKAERAKQLMESVKTGLKNEDALELPEMKALLSTASTRRPSVPKLNLLKDLKKHGANYANSAQIDKEAYANAGVKDSKEGIDDKPDLWLQKMGYMDFEESTEETVNQAWQMIEDALSGKEVYRLEDQDRVAQIEAYDENLKLLQEIFPDFMGVADTRRMISELERKGYRVVEKKDIKALEKALDRLTDTEKKKDEKQFLTMARRVREGVIAELEKRQIAGKDQMVELLKNAKTVEEITSAVDGVLAHVTSAWDQTEEGKQEQRKAELPKTDWGKKRTKLLAEINGIVKKAGESVAEAQKTLSSFVGRILTEEEAKEKERAERIIKNSNLEGQIIKALMESVRGEAHINPADINKIVARLAHSLQRNRLITEYSVDDFIKSAKKIQEKNYKKYIFKKLGDIFSRKVFEKVGTTKRLKYSPQAARFLTDAHKVWNSKLEDVQKEYEKMLLSLAGEKDNPPDQFEVLRRMAISLKADPEAQSSSTFQDFYETVLAAVRGDAMNKRMEVLKRIVDEQNLRLAMKIGLEKRKLGKAEIQFLLHGGTDFQTMLSMVFGKAKIKIPESVSGVVEIDFRDELSPETEQMKAAIFVHEARQKLVQVLIDSYGLNSADQAITKVAELQKDTMEILNYGNIKDEKNGQIIARLMDEKGKVYTDSAPKKEIITKEEIITFWLWNQDHDFVETKEGVEDYGLSGRLIRAYGKEQLNAMFDKLTEEDKRFGRALQKMLSDVHSLESEVHQRLYGFALPQKENYFPSVTERIEDSIDYKQQIIDNAKSPSFIKERVKSKRPVQKRVSPTKLVMSHLVRASEFIYESEKYTKLRRLINTSTMKDSFTEKFGEKDGNALYTKLQDLLVQQGPAQRKAKSELLSLSEKAFNGWVKASLGLKVVTGVKQFASSISFAEKMPAEKWAMWFAEGLANPRKTAEFMHKMSPYIQTRYQSGGVNESVSRAMTQDSIQPFATRWNNLTNMLLINTRLGDKASLIYGGYPYLRYLIEEKGMKPEAAAREFEKQAVRSMQSNLKANLSMAQSNADSLPARIVLAFKNQQMQYLRKVADSYVQWKNKEISTKQFGKVLLLYLVLNPMVYTLLSIGWLSDDEEERKNDLFRLAISPITQSLDAYPAIGAIVEYSLESIYRLVQEENLSKPRKLGTPMVDDFYRDLGKVISNINSGDAETMDFMMAFLDFAKYFGVPVGTLANTVGGVKDIATGKPVRGLMRTVGYTKNRSSKVTGDEE